MSLLRDYPTTASPSPRVSGASSSVPVMARPDSQGIVDWAMRVPLSAKLLGANMLAASVAITALVIGIGTHPAGGITELLVPLSVVLFSVGVSVVLVSIALRPLRELERTAQRVWAGDLSVRARPSTTEDHDIGRVRGAINLLLDGLSSDRARMQRLALHAITVGDRERARVGRELHESSAQWLAGMTLELSALAKTATTPERREALERLQQSAQQVMEQVRSLSETLHPRVLDDLGLAPALAHLARKTTARGVSANAETVGAGQRIPRHVASVLYDVAREAVANAVAHAAAHEVLIQLTTDEGHAQLIIEDDGRGMDVSEAQKEGFGLFSMRERIALVNGTFELESRPGRGTRVTATVAISDEEVQ